MSRAEPDRLPIVSIIIPVYNGSNYLGEAIRSALDQTYSAKEVIVINDGSNDGGRTRTVAEQFASSIRYFEKGNGGVASALNEGISRMRGEYFSWLSHDDVFPPDKIGAQVKFLSDKPKGTCVYGDVQYIDEDSRPTGVRQFGPSDRGLFLYHLVIDGIHGCSTLIHRCCFEKIGKFREDLRVVQDHEMWARIGQRFDFLHEPAVRILSRQHSRQGSQNLTSSGFRELDRFYMSVVPGAILELWQRETCTEKRYALLVDLAVALLDKKMTRSSAWVICRLCVSRSGTSLARRLMVFAQLCQRLFELHLRRIQGWMHENHNQS